MAKPEKGVGRTKDNYPDPKYDKGSKWRSADRRKILYKQSAIRDRRNSEGNQGTLDGRKLSLASGCDLSGGWEPYIRETSSL